MGRLTYGIVTPARNEAENLRSLAGSLASQTVLPTLWVIVDDASTDGTDAVAGALDAAYPWVAAIPAPPVEEDALLGRGRRTGRDVVAFEAGLALLRPPPDIALKLDADVTLPPDYFERLLEAFAADPTLGIAGGTCLERQGGAWRATHVTGAHVRGAARAYRWACLEQVMPLEKRIGWDGVDEVKATLRGWTTRSLDDLAFFHHRRVGERDGTRRSGWATQGRAAHFLGYRPSYLVLRTLFRTVREPAALAMASSYAAAGLAREPRCSDPAVLAYVRSQQRLRALPARAGEALGWRTQAATESSL
jgi:glycosyltransferase involved in cell wall biosynthesis